MRHALAVSIQSQRWLLAAALSALLHGGLLMGPPPNAQRRWEARAQPSVQQQAAAVSLQTRTFTVATPTVVALVESAAPVPRPIAAKKSAPVARSTATAPSITVPAAADLHYLLRQGGQEGTARLRWQPQGSGYQLSLARELGGRTLPTWRSEGETGAQGLAPNRYAQQRQGRDTRATNFRRDEGIISFSASTEQVALSPGVQDRLSGWLQLAAMIATTPARYPPGSALRLTIVGLRGEAHEQVYEVLGLEAVTLADGLSLSPPALRLHRAALGAYDGAVELWLAPERDYLPVRVLVGQPDERGWELLLRAAEPRD